MEATQKKNKYEIDMCNGTIMDKLISFALPLMVSSILQLLFNAVDIIVVGRFTGSQALAAVGSTTALINMFVNLFIGVSLGANVLSARFYAAGKEREMSETVHTAMTFALISGIVMVFVGLFCTRGALELMDTPADVIDQAALYMKIYFCSMPFFMLYNYGAAVLRAVGDTKRPLLFLIISGAINAVLNLFLVIAFSMGVAGVAIATVISQVISGVLVLWCLFTTDSCYRLQISKLGIKGEYLLQIFQVGVPAGIQSVVINFSNVLLQSSVNSFGSIAMAGYTAANNIFGFLFVSVNSITQACMSFTSQNYGAGKKKTYGQGTDRLYDPVGDRSGNAGWKRQSLRSAAASHLHNGCGRYCLWNGDSAVYDVDLLFMRHHGSDSGSLAGHGTFGGTYDIVHYRYGGNENLLDLRSIPNAPVVDGTVFILSGLLAGNDPAAGGMFLFCQKESTQHHAAGRTVISGRFSGVKVPG